MPYRDVLWAALLINVFALAFLMFLMNVYDRVVPNNPSETVWAMSIGVLPSAGSPIGEAQRKIEKTELTFRNDAHEELSDVMGKLNALNEGAVALADRVEKAQVKSPVRDRVQRLLANSVGGVVQPGKDIVEIVPLNDNLVLEARVQLPSDLPPEGFL